MISSGPMLVRIAACLSLVASCGGGADSSVVSTPSSPVEPAATVETTPTRRVATVRGRLRAHDGGPLRTAEFKVVRSGFMEAAAKGVLAEDGGFHVEVEPGVYALIVSAVDHAEVVQAILVERAVEVRGNLGTHERAEPGATLAIRSELRAADGRVIAAGPDTAVRAADGTYRIDLGDLPKDAVNLRYQLGSGNTYNGPLADTHESDGGGNFWSVISLGGRDDIVLDLAALPPAGKPASLTWSGEPPEVIAARAYRDTWMPRVTRLQESMPLIDGKILEPGEAQEAKMAALAAEALAATEAAGTDDARMLLRLAHLDLFGGHDDEAAARTHAGWALERVDPLDPRLGLFWGFHVLMFRAHKSADAAFAARVEAWYARMQANPEPDVALGALASLIDLAHKRGEVARVAELLAEIRGPRFANMYRSEYLVHRFDPDRALQQGKRLPDFEFPALVAGGPAITSAERAGRTYLVEFWATWCGPCVTEMPELHAAYAKVNGAASGQGKDGQRRLAPVERPRLEFVSVSFDGDRGEVGAFREKHWSMPWTHAFVGAAGQKEVMDRFGFSGIPTTILVDGSGTIVEVGEALQGERLLPTLERALAPRAAAAP